MNFSTYFRLTSYATIAAAALALLISGGVGVYLAITFAIVMIAAWKLEGTRWQLTERVALVVILASLPVFYFDWRTRLDRCPGAAIFFDRSAHRFQRAQARR